VRNADNRFVRLSAKANEGLNLFCDGKLVVTQARKTTNGINGAGTNFRYCVLLYGTRHFLMSEEMALQGSFCRCLSACPRSLFHMSLTKFTKKTSRTQMHSPASLPAAQDRCADERRWTWQARYRIGIK
jgi:hypothetical protein